MRLMLAPGVAAEVGMVALTLFGFGVFGASALDGQAPSYLPRQLDCARFRQSIQSDIRIETRGRVSRETAGREAVLVVRASDRDGGIGLESWFDSLGVWRASSGDRSSPDTDGLIGGRYWGWLGPKGGYRSGTIPFIPDEVAEIADLRSAPGELFPPLPAEPLRIGDSWTDLSGWKLRRLADSTTEDARFQRYQASGHRVRKQARMVGDTLPVEVREAEDESGIFLWDSVRGLRRWDRRITAETAVPAGGVIRSAIRTRIEQQVRVERILGPGPDPAACR